MYDIFTFHNVSINTPTFPLSIEKRPQFTFHNVSINTTIADSFVQEFCLNLHSTMFLLIHRKQHPNHYTNLYLHSTMFLLIPRKPDIVNVFRYIYIPQCFY